MIYKKDPDAASEMAEAASDNNDHTGAIYFTSTQLTCIEKLATPREAEEHQARAEEHRKLETAGGCDGCDLNAELVQLGRDIFRCRECRPPGSAFATEVGDPDRPPAMPVWTKPRVHRTC